MKVTLKLKYLVATFILVIFGIAIAMLLRNKVDDIHQLNYTESGFTRLPMSSVATDRVISNDELQSIRGTIELELKKRRMLISSYRVQLIAYEMGDQNYIWVNGFCNSIFGETKNYWKRHYISITDMGMCIFEGAYDPRANLFLNWNWGG